MFEKKLEMSLLLDFYGATLTDRKRDVMNFYYNEDFSLSEIADEVGITRQGVRELIKKSESELEELEKTLGLAKRFLALRELADSADEVLERHGVPTELYDSIKSLTEAVRK